MPGVEDLEVGREDILSAIQLTRKTMARLALGELGAFTPSMWTGLSELRFAASGDLVIDA